MWIQANFYPIPGLDGQVDEVLILHHDVSELMEAKRAAEISLEQFKRIAKHVPIAMQIYDSKGYSAFTNDQHTQVFGCPPPPGYCTLNDSLVEASGNLHLIHAAFEGKPGKLPLFWYNPAHLEGLNASDTQYVGKMGRNCAIETYMIPVLDGSGKVENVIYIFKDVTGELFMQQERERALKERDDAKTLIQNILDQTKAVIYIKDVEGKFIFINAQFCRIFEKSPEDILGKKDHDLFPKEIADEYRKNDLHVQNTHSHIESEETAVHADEKTHTYLSLKFPIRDSTGSLYGVCGISTDVSQHRELEQQLSTAKRMEAVGLLAGGIAHDFNNILAVILLVADTLLIKGTTKETELRKSVDAIKTAAGSAGLLTRKLLLFGRRQLSQPKNTDLGIILSEMKDILSNALGEDIHFSLEVPSDLWPVFVDPVQVEQVLTNLCFNARDAMPKGGELRLSLRNRKVAAGDAKWRIGCPSGDFVELTVSDTGTGIAPEHQERIFEPFFTTKKEAQGSGLGLATVYGIVQGARGDIAVESTLGKGCVFRVCFPKAHGVAAAAPRFDRMETRPHHGKETILLVEDQTMLRQVTVALLRECGYTVIEAKDGKSALAKWKTAGAKVDLVMTDVVMPKMNGADLVRKLSGVKRRRKLKTLFVSAYSGRKLSNHRFPKDGFHFLKKPYTAAELLSKLREVLAN